jgi:acyl-coenzyme A synthetase/AMP-(fatty) acid ligase/acyl carrier protein
MNYALLLLLTKGCVMSSPMVGIGGAPDGAALRPLTDPAEYRNLVERLAEVAAAQPDQIAVEDADGRLTYGELVERMWRVAASISPELDEERRPVGVFAAQGVDGVAAVLGVLAAGRPFVLLDVLLPDARIAVIAERAGLDVVLADEARIQRARSLPGVRVVRGLRPDAAPIAGSATPTLPDTALEDPGSIMFTSGSTGLPKAVTFGHGTYLASAALASAELGLGPADRIGLTFPWAFAAGQELLMAALANGCTACLRDIRVSGTRDVLGWIESARPTTLHGTPSLFRSLLASWPVDTVLPSVRLVVIGGEKVHARDVETIRPHLNAQAVVANQVGSSETGMFSWYPIRGDDPLPVGNVPAGRGSPLRQLTVADANGDLLPPGEPGTLCITSRWLSRGYWLDPEGTAARFALLPDGRVRYTSGDRAQIDADGTVRLLARTDDAVKIRGYLVEPAEVEAVLRSLDNIADTVVRGVEDESGQARLVAWVVPDPRRRTPSGTTVRTELSRLLPDWMVPRQVVLLSELPRNSNGKADVRALPAPPPRPAPVPPATVWERRVERVWAPVLALESVGRDESFSALGGDSLAVEEMLVRVQEELGVSATTADLAENPTLEQFAARVGRLHAGGTRPGSGVRVRLRTTGSRPPVYCFAGAGAQAAYFELFAAALGPDQPVDAFQVNGFENPGIPDWTVRRTARRFVRSITERASGGPVLLVGHSLGGLLALEAAQLLRAQGHEVPLVTLLDTYLPPRARPAGAPPVEPPEQRTPGQVGLWHTRLRVLGAGLWRHSDPQVRKEVFHEHGARIAHYHRPQPWDGRVQLFLSAENGDDPSWWDPFLIGEREVHRFSCDHVALLRRPYVEEVAGRVASAVDDVLARR